MSGDSFISDTLEEILVSMASSLRQTQEILNTASPIDSFGRVVPSYHIPYLDFELEFTVTNNKTNSGRKTLRFLPFTSSPPSSSNRKVSSTITGRFIAIPPGEGVPIPVLSANVSKSQDGSLHLTVLASNSAGEVLSDIPIELNFDKESSQALSIAAGVAAPKLNDAVIFDSAVPVTNAAGEAVATLTLSGPLQQRAVVVVRAELGHESVLVAFSKQSI